jgi:hypothetical protein
MKENCICLLKSHFFTKSSCHQVSGGFYVGKHSFPFFKSTLYCTYSKNAFGLTIVYFTPTPLSVYVQYCIWLKTIISNTQFNFDVSI